MSDLVQRLRSRVIVLHCMGADEVYPDKTAHEAADEIERLQLLLRDCDNVLTGYTHLRSTLDEAISFGHEAESIVALIDRIRGLKTACKVTE